MHWAVILAGGSGTRFWPLSTPTRPKQLLPLLAGGESTAVQALQRLEGLVPREQVLVVTGPALAEPLRAVLGLPPENILTEPRPASTGPALAWAASEAARRDPEAVLLCLHADWHVPDPGAFRAAARRALAAAGPGDLLLTVGVRPTRPETGYGYLEPGEPLAGGARRVARFREKPDRATAERLVAAGASWNSGLFAWRARLLLDELTRHAPEIGPHLGHLASGDVPAFFRSVRPVSIDVGLLERSDRVAMVEGDFAWDDVGTWEALARVRQPDPVGNVVEGPVHLDDASGCIAWTDGPPVVAVGLRDLVIVAAHGRILVMDRARAAALKDTLDQLPPSTRDLPS